MVDEADKRPAAKGAKTKHKFKVRTPKFTAKWDREWVIPDNALLKNDAKVKMEVNSTYPSNKPKASISVLQEWDGKITPKVILKPLKLTNNKVVLSKNGEIPSYKFKAVNGLWDKYDKLDYHFECEIVNKKEKTSKALKIKRWHVQALDNSDNSATNPNNIYKKFRITEGSNFRNSFSGSGDDKAHTWDFNANSTTYKKFGENMQNTYSFVYTGHGAVMCKKCHKMFGSVKNLKSDAEFGKWTKCETAKCGGSPRSTFCVGGWKPAGTPSFMDAHHIQSKSIVPVAPKYLVFSVCCGGAFETSLYDAFIGRGTKYCVGFRKSTRCDWARDYAKSFFDTWSKTHK
jgi:hypothetical protein